MSKNGLIVAEPGSAIQAYAPQAEVTTLTDRLMDLHPDAKTLGQETMRLVAQASLATGANPLPPPLGEIYVWADQRSGVSVDLYIGYYRRVAARADVITWIEEPRLMTDAEKRAHQIAQKDLGAICRAARLSKVKDIQAAGFGLKDALELAARSETAVVRYGEMFQERDTQWRKAGTPINPPNGRSWAWVAMKRAEKAWYRAEALIQSSLTDRIAEHAERITSELDAREERQRVTRVESLEDANRILGLGDARAQGLEDAADGEEYVIIDGDELAALADAQADLPLEPEPEPDGRTAYLENAGLTDASAEALVAAVEAEPAEMFLTTLRDSIPLFGGDGGRAALVDALKALGYKAVPGKGAARADAALDIIAYASYRGEGYEHLQAASMASGAPASAADEEE